MPIAFRASQLFFCIADLGTVDPMYQVHTLSAERRMLALFQQFSLSRMIVLRVIDAGVSPNADVDCLLRQYSLEWFINLFEMSIEKAVKGPSLEERLHNLSACFTELLYTNVCRSLFEKHKLLFAFLLTIKIMQGEKRLDEEELRFFLQGATSLDLDEPNPLDCEGWLSDKMWGEILAANKTRAMPGFAQTFKSNLRGWEAVFLASDPLDELEAVAGDAYDHFQKLCILRALRPDVVVPGVQNFIAKVS